MSVTSLTTRRPWCFRLWDSSGHSPGCSPDLSPANFMRARSERRPSIADEEGGCRGGGKTARPFKLCHGCSDCETYDLSRCSGALPIVAQWVSKRPRASRSTDRFGRCRNETPAAARGAPRIFKTRATLAVAHARDLIVASGPCKQVPPTLRTCSILRSTPAIVKRLIFATFPIIVGYRNIFGELRGSVS